MLLKIMSLKFFFVILPQCIQLRCDVGNYLATVLLLKLFFGVLLHYLVFETQTPLLLSELFYFVFSTKMVKCSSDTEFFAKLHCIRLAFTVSTGV